MTSCAPRRIGEVQVASILTRRRRQARLFVPAWRGPVKIKNLDKYVSTWIGPAVGGVGTSDSGADSEGTDGSPSVHPDP